MSDRTAAAIEVVAIGVRQVAITVGFLLALASVPIPDLGPEDYSERWAWSSKVPKPPSAIPEAEALRIARRNGARVNGVILITDPSSVAGRYHAFRDIAQSLRGAHWVYHIEIDAATGEVLKREIFKPCDCLVD